MSGETRLSLVFRSFLHTYYLHFTCDDDTLRSLVFSLLLTARDNTGKLSDDDMCLM